MAVREWGLKNKHGGKIALSAWYHMLHNPFYYGCYEYPQGSGNWYQGNHEPMIDQIEYEKIQLMLGRRGTTRPKKYSFKYNGATQCGYCGAAVIGEHKVKKCKNGNTHFYIYYHCTGRKDPSLDAYLPRKKNWKNRQWRYWKN